MRFRGRRFDTILSVPSRNWQAFDNLPFSNIEHLTFDPSDDNLLYVTTFGGSIWRGPALPHGQ